MIKKLSEKQIVRVPSIERKYGIDDLKIFAYLNGNDLEIVGEVIADYILDDFCLECTVYDQDGDIVESLENYDYGMYYCTRMIKADVFFNRFPFQFSASLDSGVKISKIRIVPE